MKVNRVKRIKINKNHLYYNKLKELCLSSTKLYNKANNKVRYSFFNEKVVINNEEKAKYITNFELEKLFAEQKIPEYTALPAQTAQKVLKNLHENWKSFFKKKKKDPKAKPPWFKEEMSLSNIKFTSQQIKIKDNKFIILPKLLNFQFDLFKENINIRDITIKPYTDYFMVIVSYQKEIEDITEHKDYSKIAGIDLGLNNLVSMLLYTGESYLYKGSKLKSINKYFNHKISELQAELITTNNRYNSKKIDTLWTKRNNIMNNALHKISNDIVKILLESSVEVLVIGHNNNQKQKSKLKNFVQIPVFRLIKLLKYKCEANNIKLIEVNESYTSGTSFLDEEEVNKKNYNINRRTKRGLFISNNKIKINSDINSSGQIIKKIKKDFNVKVLLNPIVRNVY